MPTCSTHDGDLRESLPPRLDRYIIADDVQVEDVTEELSLFHLLASEMNDLPNEYKVVRARRFLNAGWDVWTKKSEHAQAREILSKHAFSATRLRRKRCGLKAVFRAGAAN